MILQSKEFSIKFNIKETAKLQIRDMIDQLQYFIYLSIRQISKSFVQSRNSVCTIRRKTGPKKEEDEELMREMEKYQEDRRIKL